jgi:peptide/nickel transport system permease protein
MSQYVARRLLQVIFVLLGVTIAVFLMLRLIPGDVVDVLLGTEGTANPEQRAEMRRLFGIDRPLHEQYVAWLADLLSGDLGTSIRTGRPILPDIIHRLPVTFQLTAMAMVLSLAAAVPLGTISAIRPNTRIDAIVRFMSLVGLSVPSFWIATMLILLVSKYGQGVFPTFGYTRYDDDFLGSWRSLFLPAIALAAPNTAILARMTRSSMLEILRQEYVVSARAKGLRETTVISRHALRNALIPVVTVAGVQVGYLLGGAIIIEQVFALPGIGTFILNGIGQRDYPAVQAGVLFVATTFVLANLIVDISYGWLDPRIRIE